MTLCTNQSTPTPSQEGNPTGRTRNVVPLLGGGEKLAFCAPLVAALPCCVLATTLCALGLPTTATAQPLFNVIENETLKLEFQSPGGSFKLIHKPTQRAFVTTGTLSRNGGVAAEKDVADKTFGAGRAVEVSYPDGSKDSIMVFHKLPFALIRSTLHNGSNDVSVTPRFMAASVTLDLGRPASQLKTLGSGGLLSVDKNPGSYLWLAAVEPQSRNGVVLGWLTHERGSGVLFSDVENGKARVEARIDYGNLRLAPGKSEELETLAIGYFDDARLGLETYAGAIAKVHHIQLKPQPTGYCTWYSQPHGGAADERRIVELAAFAATNLAPFGFSVVQIDDKWQAGWKRNSPSSPKKDFRTHDPKGPYPSGMKAAADKITSLGLVPGIWFMPFAGTVGDPFFDQHLDWFAKGPDGKPFDTPWGGTCLDLSHPGARAHVSDITRRICREWGYDYIKIDGLWTGTATKQLYVNSGYKEDDMGEAVFHDPDKTNVEIFRDGLRLVREAAGEKVFILGCNAPQNMRTYGGVIGLVDAMRIGPDNKADWKSLLRGPVFGSRHYFMHGRVWWNDPDPVYVRTNMPLKHAQLICSWVALSGQLNLSSEWLPGQPPERLDILKRTMPSHDATARPVDLFENDPPRLWTVTSEERGVYAASTPDDTAASATREASSAATVKRPEGRAPERTVIGWFNWEGTEQRFDVPLERLGLRADTEYVAFDYWNNRFIPSVKGRLQLSVPAESCVVLAVRPRADHPQLLSTSRHVTQGLVDVTDEKWDAASKTLSGRSKVVGNDPVELRVVAGTAEIAGVEVSAADRSASVNTSYSPHSSYNRVKLTSPTSREVAWSIRFK
jgi:hypothetical protein